MATLERAFSSLLTEDEHDTLFWLIGQHCTPVCTTVAQMYTAKYFNDKKWQKLHAGVVCIVKDNKRSLHFIQMYCLTKKRKLWEHEVKNDLNYNVVIPPTHTFESEDFKVGFNFRDDNEALGFYSSISQVLSLKELGSTSSFVDVDLKPSNAVVDEVDNDKEYKCFPNAKNTLRKNSKLQIGHPKCFEHKIHIAVNEKEGLSIEGDLQKIKQFIIDSGENDIDLTAADLKQEIYKYFKKNGAIKEVLVKHAEYVAKEKKAKSKPVRAARDTYLNENTYKPTLQLPNLPPKQNQSSQHSSFDFDNPDSDYDNLKSWETLYKKKDQKMNQEYVSSKYDPLDYDVPNDNPKIVTPVEEKSDNFATKCDDVVSTKPSVPSKENVLRKISLKRSISEKSQTDAKQNDVEQLEDIINNIATQLQNKANGFHYSKENSTKHNQRKSNEEDYDYL